LDAVAVESVYNAFGEGVSIQGLKELDRVWWDIDVASAVMSELSVSHTHTLEKMLPFEIEVYRKTLAMQ
jgi:hypothetical protein